MRNVRLLLGIGLLVTACIVLVATHGSESVAGLTPDQFADLARLSTLLLVIGSGIFFARRHAGPHLRHAAVWLGLAVVLVAGYAYRPELESVGNRMLGVLRPGQPVVDGETVVIRRADGEHFMIVGEVDGTRVTMLLDTGASLVTLTERDAREAGIDVDNLAFSTSVSTANGSARVARARIESLQIGSVVMTNIEAFVARDGSLAQSLLGMNVLSRLSGWSVQGDRLILVP